VLVARVDRPTNQDCFADTTTPAGKLTFHVFAALSEFERDVLCERTRAGLVAARKRGVKLGRPRSLTPEQVEMARGA
jgi:DNA invertase Pin-like site-specific DNA recombinase